MSQESPKLKQIQQVLENPVETMKSCGEYPINQKFQIQECQKVHKEIIKIDSSQQKSKSLQQDQQGQQIDDQQEQVVQVKSSSNKKAKRPQYKCQLCKSQGKKNEMKKCSACKYYSHLHCLQQREAKGRYICDRCKDQQGQCKTLKKQKKQQQKNEITKTTLKKIQKQKKQNQSNKSLLKFKQKYPFYFAQQGQKIRFPVQDKLLLIYKDYFDISQLRVIPIQHPVIPSIYLGQYLQLQNFIVSFSAQFQQQYNGPTQKNLLYKFLSKDGSDPIFEKILINIIRIYLKDIYQKNKTQNVRVLNDNCFFILLGTILQITQQSYQLTSLIPQILTNLALVPSMKLSFTNIHYQNQIHPYFPKKLNHENKLSLLTKLISGLSQVDAFHDMVAGKSQKIGQMTKDKAQYVVNLKNNQAQALNRLRSNKTRGRGRNLKNNNRVIQDDQQQNQQQSQSQIKTRTRNGLQRSNNKSGIATRNNRVRTKPLNLDSDDQISQIQVSDSQVSQMQQESENDDQCDVCKQVGEVICCDTCPKVFHQQCLGLKQFPQGDWSCMDCLHRINTQRQTRSRAKK